MTKKAVLFGAASTAALITVASVGMAAEAPALEEIIVTAQKREESLQKVPVAVTAVTSADIEKKFLGNMQDIKKVVPNLYLEEALSAVTTPKAWIRGIGVDNQVFSFDSPIGFYVDNVYYARVTGAMGDLFDLERVEVLRGPQGTIYGRNSSVGAIRLITKSPNLKDVEVMAEAAYGSKEQMNGRLMVSVPITEDKVGMRIALSTRNNDGWMTDMNTGEKRMTEDVQAGRASLLFAPSEEWRITLRGDYMSDKSKTRIGSNFLIDPDDDIYTYEATPGIPSVDNIRPWGTSATVEWSGNGVDVTSITAYRDLKYRNAGDVDGRDDVQSFQVQQQDLDQWQFTQELFASGDELGNTPLKWVAGAFYLQEKNTFHWALRIFAPPTTQRFDQDTDSFAAYAQLTYPATDKLNITGGARYTYEKKSIEAIQYLADGTLNPNFVFADSIKANKVTWRAAADYQATDDLMLYVSASTGFRSGGFNGSARDVPSILSGSFGPEDSTSIEGGFKSQLWDKRVRFNAAYFWSLYENLQQAITQSDGTISTRNVEATVHGLEADMVAIPVEGLELNASLGLMFDNIKNSDLVLKNTPKWNIRGGAAYTIPVMEMNGSLRIGGDVNYNSDSFNDTNNGPFTNTGKYAIVDAYVTYESDDGHWSASVSGYNLTDKFVNIHTFNIAGGFISSVHFPNYPRRWLATVRYKY